MQIRGGTSGEVATQPSAEASAGACLGWHSCCCRTVQPQGRGAKNQQQQCLTSPGEALAVPGEGCERQTKPVTNEESIGQKLESPLYTVSFPPAAVSVLVTLLFYSSVLKLCGTFNFSKIHAFAGLFFFFLFFFFLILEGSSLAYGRLVKEMLATSSYK